MQIVQVSKSLMTAVLAVGFIAVTAMPTLAHAEATATEKAQEASRDAAAKGKKGMNRVKEAVCAEGDAKCAAKKVGHRVDETGDKVTNKVKDAKEKSN